MAFGNLNTIENSIEYKIKAINFQKSCSIRFLLSFSARGMRTHINSVISDAYVFSVTNERREKKNKFIAKSIFKLVFLLKVEKWLRQTLTLSKSHTGHIKLNLIRVEFVHVIDVSFSSFSFRQHRRRNQTKKKNRCSYLVKRIIFQKGNGLKLTYSNLLDGSRFC